MPRAFGARNARVSFGGALGAGGAFELQATKWNLVLKSDELEISNFTTNGFTDYIDGMKDADVSVEGWWDADNYPTSNPPGIYPGVTVSSIHLYLSQPGVANKGLPPNVPAQIVLPDFWLFPSAIVLDCTCEAAVRDLLRYNFRFKNKGVFYAPGAAVN